MAIYWKKPFAALVSISKLSLALGIVLGSAWVASAQTGVSTASAKLKYKFSVGDKAKYRLKLRHEVDMEGQQKINNVVTQSYVFDQKVDKVRASGISLSLDFPEVRVKFGRNAPEFDSRKKEHIAAARQKNSGWRLFGALLTSKVSTRVKPTGEVAFFRVKTLAKDYDDEKTRFYVQKAIEAVKNHAFLLLPDVKAEKGAAWKTLVPVKFVGGALSGHDVFVPTTLELKKIEKVQGKRQAVFEVSSYEQPKIEIGGASIKGVKVDLKVKKLAGSVVFLLDEGSIKSYSFKIETSLKLSVSGRLVNRHSMKVSAELDRL